MSKINKTLEKGNIAVVDIASINNITTEELLKDTCEKNIIGYINLFIQESTHKKTLKNSYVISYLAVIKKTLDFQSYKNIRNIVKPDTKKNTKEAKIQKAPKTKTAKKQRPTIASLNAKIDMMDNKINMLLDIIKNGNFQSNNAKVSNKRIFKARDYNEEPIIEYDVVYVTEPIKQVKPKQVFTYDSDIEDSDNEEDIISVNTPSVAVSVKQSVRNTAQVNIDIAYESDTESILPVTPNTEKFNEDIYNNAYWDITGEIYIYKKSANDIMPKLKYTELATQKLINKLDNLESNNKVKKIINKDITEKLNNLYIAKDMFQQIKERQHDKKKLEKKYEAIYKHLTTDAKIKENQEIVKELGLLNQQIYDRIRDINLYYFLASCEII
jgi:hypothetical protein